MDKADCLTRELPPALCQVYPCSPRSLIPNGSLVFSTFSLPLSVFIYNNDKKFSVCGFQTLWVEWKKTHKKPLIQQTSYSFVVNFRPVVVFWRFVAILTFFPASLSAKIPWFNTRKFVCVDKPALCFNDSYVYGILMNIAFSEPFV